MKRIPPLAKILIAGSILSFTIGYAAHAEVSFQVGIGEPGYGAPAPYPYYAEPYAPYAASERDWPSEHYDRHRHGHNDYWAHRYQEERGRRAEEEHGHRGDWNHDRRD